MITFVPTIASYFIDDYPCLSLTEFMLAYEKATKFPFEIGINSIPAKK